MAKFSQQLEAGRQSKVEFIKLVSELERQIPQATSKEQTAEFFHLIVPLQKIAQEHQFSELGGDPLGKFIQTSSNAIAKWLDVTTDNLDDLQLFVTLAPESGQILFLDHQNQIFSQLLSNQEQFLAAYVRFATLATFTSHRIYQIRQGELLGTIFRTWDLSIEQALTLAQNAKGAESWQELLQYLQRKVYQAGQASEFNLLIQTVLLIAEQIKGAQTLLPGHLLDAPGFTLMAIFQQIFNKQQAFATTFIDPILSALDTRQLHDLASTITQVPFQSFGKEARSALIQLAIHTSDLCVQHALHRQVLLLEEYLGRLMLLEKTGHELEGVYSVQMNGIEFRLLLIRTQIGQLAATLTNQLLSYGMFFSYYHRQSEQIIITRYQSADSSSGTDYGINFALKIQPLANHRLKLWFNSGTKLLTGIAQKNITIPNYLERPSHPVASRPVRPQGLYRGKIGHYPSVLMVTNTANYYFAQLSFLEVGSNNVLTSVGLNSVTFQPWNYALYLTSSETNALSFVHLRLVSSPDGKQLNGFYYSGGPVNHVPVKFTLGQQ